MLQFDTEADREKQETVLINALGNFFDATWYRQRYPDIVASGLDPIRHFIRYGLTERRDPNRFFDCAWYVEHYPDVSASGHHPLLHYLSAGAAELRNPHPRFDARFYVAEHPDAATNPLLYHIRVGAPRGYLTERPIDIRQYLPSELPAYRLPSRLTVDVVIPVYRGLEDTQHCLHSVLADPSPPLGRIIVVEDRSPEPKLVEWLVALAAEGKIELLRNPRNLGFVHSVNRGMEAAGRRDVVLLNSDTRVPKGWLGRLAAQAYAGPRVATVSPFSNNATICGYPDNDGGDMPFGASLETLDGICQTINAGRHVVVPTTVGFCMYIRRAALDQVGLFDADRFPMGYGEENDFCLRAAAAGWQHWHACDTFVYHRGNVSFGDRAKKLSARAMATLERAFPDYRARIAHHVLADAVGSYRFAITAALFRQSGLPVILAVSHNLGGGVRRDIDRLAERYAGQAHFLLLAATDRGASLSVPGSPRHPELALPGERIGDLIRVLRSAGVARVHIHHLVGMDMDIRDLIHRLNLPFDLTVHDYHGICPQMNLLPVPSGLYCGEPDMLSCNTCIAARPSHGARDILSWRAERAWQFLEAERVICPSADVLARLQRFGLAGRAILAPHEPVESAPWPLRVEPVAEGKLRIAVLGVLADLKGARTVAAVAEAADPRTTEIHLIGYPEPAFPAQARKRLRITGKYDDADLPALLDRIAPHIIWFPGAAPETFSYTLSAAIAAGLPIAATKIGAFPERLEGRPLTWLAAPDTSPAEWAALFLSIRAALNQSPLPRPATLRAPVADFYAGGYLAPEATRPAVLKGTLTVATVPERYNTGTATPCAYIRLLQPLSHPLTGAGGRLLMSDANAILNDRADVIVTQRHAIETLAAAEALIDHARRIGAALIYDLDDDLLNVPAKHPDAADLRPLSKAVRLMLEKADAVWVSTPGLKDRIAAVRADALVVPNRLDERIWAHPPPPPDAFVDSPVRILCMGTNTHDRDFAMLEPALARLFEEHGERVLIDIVGMTGATNLPRGLRRIGPPAQAGRSYPGFVQWLTSVLPGWHIGLAPLLDTAFNRCKSPIKTMDYAGLGMAILASDVPVYQGSLADGVAGELVANDTRSWFAALDWMVRNQPRRRAFAAAARSRFGPNATLAGQPDERRAAWANLLPPAHLHAAGSDIPSGHATTDLTARKKRRSGRGT